MTTHCCVCFNVENTHLVDATGTVSYAVCEAHGDDLMRLFHGYLRRVRGAANPSEAAT